MSSKPENGIDSTPWTPFVRVDLDRVLRHGQHDHRHMQPGLMDLLDELRALDPALEQGVDHHDVGTQLGDLVDGPAAVGEHVEQLDCLLGVEEAADVLRDLRHVLDDQETRLVAT